MKPHPMLCTTWVAAAAQVTEATVYVSIATVIEFSFGSLYYM